MRQREIIALEKRKAKKKAKRLKEKEEKKAKERKKKEREKEKLRKKRLLIRKKKASIYNKKRRREKKEERLRQLKENGDRKGCFRIIITESGKRVKTLSKAGTLLDAYEKYNNFISENSSNVIGSKKYIMADNKKTNEVNELDFEILLVENVGSDNVYKTSFRENGGKYVESKIVDSNKHVILAKNRWLIPEYYSVYGYNPINDRKPGKWIYDNLIKKDLSPLSIKIISQLNQRIIIQNGDDINIVTCRYIEDAEILYNEIEEHGKDEKYIVFMKKVPKNLVQKFNKKIKDKTGWGKKMCSAGKHITIVPSVEHKIEYLT